MWIISGNSNTFDHSSKFCSRVLDCWKYYLFSFANWVLYTSVKQARVHLLDTQPFENTFGPKSKRKRPKLMAADYDSLVKKADGSQGTWMFFPPLSSLSTSSRSYFHLVGWPLWTGPWLKCEKSILCLQFHVIAQYIMNLKRLFI